MSARKRPVRHACCEKCGTTYVIGTLGKHIKVCPAEPPSRTVRIKL